MRSKRDFLTLTDFSADEIAKILDAAAEMKKARKVGAEQQPLAGKAVGMLFSKSSTRTRVSFEAGIFHLGGHALYLDAATLQMGRGESLSDTAKALSGYLDAIVVRTYEHRQIEELAAAASIPVINALTDRCHPCQTLADLLTIREKRGSLTGIKIAYVGDGNNVAHSWLLGAGLLGIDLDVATPSRYEPDPKIVAESAKLAEKTGANIRLTHDPLVAVENADVIYTDTWISMGHDDEAQGRREAFAQFCVDDTLLRAASDSVMVMHCLPAHRGEEISADVIDGDHSVVWDQAENRLHTQKALLVFLLGGTQ